MDWGKIIGGIGLLIALGLVLTNPAADKTILDSGSSAGVSLIKSLQLR